jgi:hypothetical protein
MTGDRIWWRRNWWGAAAVLPLLVAVVALSPDESYQAWRDSEPREAVEPAADGWVSYGGTRARLVGVEPADLRVPGTGEPYRLAPGLAAWQSTVTFERLPDPDRDLVGCQFRLEDQHGLLYGAGPAEAEGAELGEDGSYLVSLCRPELEQEQAATFDAVSVFVLPSSSRPVALRLTAVDELRRYVRFPLG